MTVVGSLTYDHFEDVLNFWKQTADTYFPMVIIFIPQAPNVIVGDATTINNEGLLLVEEEVVGVGTLVVEQKLIRSCGKVASPNLFLIFLNIIYVGWSY